MTADHPDVRDVDDLQKEIVLLQEQLRAREASQGALQKRIAELTLEIEILKRKLFGPKAERVKNAEAQLSLLEILEQLGRLQSGDLAAADRAEAMLDEFRDQSSGASAGPSDKSGKPIKTKAKPHGRRRLEEAALPVVNVVLERPERRLAGGDKLVKIGEEVSSHLDHRPSSIVRVVVTRPKYLRPEDEGTPASSQREVMSTSTDAVAAGPTPLVKVLVANVIDLPIAKGLAGPGLLARVVVGKYADHLPLHRQVGILKREGAVFARSTLCGFVQGR